MKELLIDAKFHPVQHSWYFTEPELSYEFKYMRLCV